ncbi:unnamed protein product [Acanthocheilonema viteae]|uniref:CMP/dCMP-type deaminase domain-containing protein n=1 Tax=Acanthocheilonema viteae TaxID=6277 RepID=A0A498S1A6_ACAVI|nr:unnamed protein product [Acanthocheilonema viteae]
MSLKRGINEEEVYFLNRAFEIAVDAVINNEVPVGCVFVFEGQEVAFGRNDVNRTKNPLYHAEMVALEMLKWWCVDNGRELENVMRRTTLYVTLEPCIMCASALYHLHLKKILYGAANERFGGLVSVGTREKYGAEHFIEIVPNLSVDRAVKLLKEFYEKQNPFCPEEKRKMKKPKKSGNIDDSFAPITVLDILKFIECKMESSEIESETQKLQKSSSEKRLRVQITEGDLLCVNQCGFYGTPQWKGRCSKCWRTYQMEEKKTQYYTKNRELLSFEKFEGRRRLSTESRSLTLKSILRKSSSLTANSNSSQETIYTTAPSQSTLPSPVTPIRHRLSEESSYACDRFHEFLQNNLSQAAAHEIAQQTHHAVDKILEVSLRIVIPHSIESWVRGDGTCLKLNNLFEFQQQNVNMDDLSGMVQHFYQVLADKMRHSPLMNDSVVNVSVEEVMAEVEQYICVRAYSTLADEETADLSLQDRIRSLNWVTAGFLETTLDFSQESVRDKLDEAITEIIDMNSHRGAAEKLQCLVRCSKMIFEALKESRSGAPAGADEYLPVLIFVILKGNPPLIQSNVKFVSRFALPARVLSGESGYYFTNVSCALQFVQNMNAESLKMPREEFEAYTSGHQVPPLNAMNMGCNQSIRTMENSLAQVRQLLERQKNLKERMDELEIRVKRETDELSAEVDEILNAYPTEELKHLTEQVMIEEAEVFKSLSPPSSLLQNSSRSSRELVFIDSGNADTEEHGNHEKDITSQLSSVEDLT